MNKKKVALLVVLAAITLAVLFSGSDYFTLEYLKQSSDRLRGFYQQEPLLSVVAYALLYIFAVALSIPAASLLTILGGFLFPFWLGLILVSFASTIGCALAFLFSRYLLQSFFQQKFNQSYQRINDGFEKEGVSYLLSLRLIPLFPFFVVNVVMGLTRISLSKYFFVSQLGMLPGTAVFVFAGQQLGQLQSVSDILTPGLWFSLLLLGITPVLSSKLFRLYQLKSQLKQFKKPKRFDYQLIVIGAGAAGLVAANIASKLKSRVMLVEQHKMGGDCLNTGCVPSKALLSEAHQVAMARRFHPEIKTDFRSIKQRITNAIKTIEPHDSVERYTGLGVDCKSGHARFVSPWELQVGDRTYSSKSFVLASGASPVVPKLAGIDAIPAFTSETIWDIEQLPNTMLVVGGGAMGCELAQAFCMLGVEVTLLQRNPRLLPSEDAEFSEKMKQALEGQGVKVICAVKNIEFTSEHQQHFVCYQTEEKNSEANHVENRCQQKQGFELCLFATGRQANVNDMGLQGIGLKMDGSRVAVDENLKTSLPHVFAAGDVCAKRQFTHVAGHQGAMAGLNAVLRGLWSFRANTQIEALAVYTQPEYARAGFTKAQLYDLGRQSDVTEVDYSELDRAVTEGAQGCIKVVTEKGSDKILGVAVFGQHAAEIVQQFLYFMSAGKGLKSILRQQFLYPVWSAALQKVASEWYASQSSEKVDKLLAKFQKLRL